MKKICGIDLKKHLWERAENRRRYAPPKGWRNHSESHGALQQNRVAASSGIERRNQRNTHYNRGRLDFQ